MQPAILPRLVKAWDSPPIKRKSLPLNKYKWKTGQEQRDAIIKVNFKREFIEERQHELSMKRAINKKEESEADKDEEQWQDRDKGKGGQSK